MTTTPNHSLPLPSDGQVPWGDDYRTAMTIVDSKLPKVAGSMYAEENANTTTIAEAGTAVKANIPTQEGPPCPCVTHTANRLTLDFENGPRLLLVVGSVVVSSTSNQTIRIEVRKNGQAIPGAVTKVRKGAGDSVGSGALAASVAASSGDYLEVWVANETSTAAVTVVDLTLALRG